MMLALPAVPSQGWPLFIIVIVLLAIAAITGVAVGRRDAVRRATAKKNED
jgi:hypothetical protein